VDKELEGLKLDIVGGFNLEEVRGMVDQEPHLVLGGPVSDVMEDFLDWGTLDPWRGDVTGLS
jgi:hypothetical protein